MAQITQGRLPRPYETLAARLALLDAGTEARDLDDEYRSMATMFQRCGGLVSCESLVECLRPVDEQPLSRLARWIVSRSVVIVPWRGQTRVPLFQFSPGDWRVREDVTLVLDELRNVFDDWELACWFATPNAWLQCRPPLDCLDMSRPALLHAARVERYIVRG